MSYQPGLWLFILASLVMGGLLSCSWRFRRQETGREFLFLMAAALVWSASFTIETAVSSLQGKLVFFIFEFAGITLIPPAWVFLVLSFTGQKISRRRRLLLLFMPLLTNLIIWTNPLHHAFTGNPWILYSPAPFPVLIPDYRFWFYSVHVPLSYGYILVAFGILLRFLLTLSPIFRLQARLMLLSLLLPTLIDVAYVLGYSPVEHYNYTTAAFSISGAILMWSLFRYRFLDLLPLARNTVIDNLSDGIIVIDHKDRVIEINGAAKRFFGLSDEVLSQTVGAASNEYLRAIAEIIQRNQSEESVEITGATGRYFDLRISPVINSRELRIGWVAVAHDITERVNLFHQVETISNQDSLTGIYNQRCFLELCERALTRAKLPPGMPLSLVMFDVDHFKTVNDCFGHGAGNRVLIAITQAVKSELRKIDLFGRLGGEEFGVLLVDVDACEAAAIVERLRASVENVFISGEGYEIRVTASFGMVSAQDMEDENAMDVEKMLHLADQYLYRAKQTGRNRVAI